MEILENLSNILESILFAAGNPVPVDIIAEKLGVSRDTYRKIEASPEDATIATAKRISEVVGIPIDQIFFVSLST